MTEKKVAVVLGMHRSGTSVLARAIQALGADLGSNLMASVEGNNPKGFFEDLEINRLCDQIFAIFGHKWDTLGVLPYSNMQSACWDDFLDQAVETLDRKIHPGELFCFKNPRVSILLPFWKAALERLGAETSYVISVRHPLEVAESLFSRDQIPRPKSLLLWLNHNMTILKETQGSHRNFVSFNDLLEIPRKTVTNIGFFLGLRDMDLNQDELHTFETEFLTKSLRHHVQTNQTGSRAPDIPSAVSSLHKLLHDLATESLEDDKEGFVRRWQKVRSNYRDLNIAYELADEYEALSSHATSMAVDKYIKLSNRYASSEKQLEASVLKAAKHASTSEELRRDLDELKHDADNLRLDANAMSERASELEKHLRTSKETITVRDDLIHKLEVDREQIESSTKSLLASHDSSIARLEEQRARLEGDQALLEKDHARLGEDCRRLELVHSRLRADYDQLEVHRSKLEEDSNQFEVQTHRELAERDFILDKYRSSRSMRLTSPLRYCRRVSVSCVQNLFRPTLSFVARTVWNLIPSNRLTITSKRILFVSTGKLFAWSSAYKNWAKHEQWLANPKLAEEKKPPFYETAPSKSVISGDQPSQTHVRDDYSKLLGLFNEYESRLHDTVPQKILDYALEISALSKLRVSVVIPTWNRGEPIIRAIDSVLTQSYEVFELIVSDDGSTDSTISVLKQKYNFEISQGRLQILENPHSGVSAARNAGVRVASGDIVAYLDSDNVWRNDYVKLMVAAFAENEEVMTAYAGLRSFDLDNDNQTERASKFDRRRLLDWNFIDLNIFMHRRTVFEQHGGFDESLSRLVDWELIIRYTRNYEPIYLPFIGVDYYLSMKKLKNITHTVPLNQNRQKVLDKHFLERVALGLERLRIAYFIYDYPALSQTFIFNELRWLIRNGYDVKVYYTVVPDDTTALDFSVDAFQVRDSTELAERFVAHRRNVCHSHFAYPGVALFVRPACAIAGIYFTFMPHAVDIFHHTNRLRNQVDEVSHDPRCLKVLVYGDFHRRFLIAQGVPEEKIGYAFQAVDVVEFSNRERSKSRSPTEPLNGVVVARFIQKKGIEYLIEALTEFKDSELSITLVGFGPLEKELRQKVAMLRLQNVKFAGPVEGLEALTNIYANADFLVAPCTEADNGDMDGFPTVILEAISAGIPVITTSISAIPDYLRNNIEAIIVKPADANSLARGMRRLIEMSPARTAVLVRRAKSFVKKRISTERTMQQLLDIWQGYSFDIILVTFDVEGYEDREDTFEIIHRIFSHTTTRFTLTIIDNASQDDFWDEVVHLVQGQPNVRLIRKTENIFCGPATNAALRLCESKYVVYICSKEGFIKSHGWEKPLLNSMREMPEVVIAGYKTHLPKYTYGEELIGHPDFDKFRGQEFAHENPGRVFEHVQGGIFIADRAQLLSAGGFNPELPQANMDVEMSYWIEAQGLELGSIEEIVSVTTKTLPSIETLITEETSLAHPLSLKSVSKLDVFSQNGAQSCNLCGATREPHSMDVETPLYANAQLCVECGSTPFGRSLYRTLSSHFQIHRNKTAALLTDDSELVDRVSERMFGRVLSSSQESELLEKLSKVGKAVDCFVIDEKFVSNQSSFWHSILEFAESNGVVFYCSETTGGFTRLESAVADELGRAIYKRGISFQREVIDMTSCALAFDWRLIEKYVFQAEHVA